MTFNHLTVKDYTTLKPFFNDQKYDLCSYSLPTLIVWSNNTFQPFWTVYRGSLIVCAEYSTESEERHIILPISPGKEFSPDELRDLAATLGFTCFWLVPDSYIARHGEEEIRRYFTIKEQNEYEDYIYLTRELSELSGNRYSKKRNLIHQFQKKYCETDRAHLESISSENIADCLDFLDEWCRIRRCEQADNNGLACEKQAAANMLQNIDKFDSEGLLLRIDGTVNAFGVSSFLTQEMGVLQFEKAFEKIKGLYQYFDNECIKRLFGKFKYVNKESDMNIPGLAHSKKSYYPIRKVKAYKLTVCNSS